MFYCTGRSDNAIKNRWHLLQRLSKRKAKQRQQIPIFRCFYTSSSTTTTSATDINNSNYVDHNQQQQIQQQQQQQQSATLPAFQSIRPTIDEHLYSICVSASSSIPCSDFMMSDDDDITVLYTVFYFLYVYKLYIMLSFICDNN